MENSHAYISLINQINGTGRLKLDGYNLKTLDEIFEWERDEIEDVICRNFSNNDIDLAIFLPKLKKHDGISLLKRKLQELTIPSSGSVLISQVLYETTKKEKYLDIIMQNIEESPDNISYVASLAGCSPSEKAYSMLVHIYINNENEVIRSTAVTGILHNKGIIHNVDDLQEITQNISLRRKFLSNDSKRRKRIIEMFEKGMLQDIKLFDF